MTYTPLHDKIIVERIKPESQTNGGIYLLKSEDADKAKVIAIGPDVDEVNVGDELLVNWNGAVKIKDELYSIKVEFVVGVYEEEKCLSA